MHIGVVFQSQVTLIIFSALRLLARNGVTGEQQLT
jgi:hypothetical protein